jgi:hypothetical protein
MSWRASFAALLAAAGVPLSAQAQSPTQAEPRELADAINHGNSGQWNRVLHRALGLPEWLDLAVEHRTRFEYLAHPFRRDEPERQSQIPHRTRLRLGADGFGPLRFLAELQNAQVRSAADDDFTGGQIDELDVLQLLVGATQPDLFGSGLRADVQAGRLSLDFGGRRLISRNGTRNTVNAFDGVHAQLGSEDLSWRVRSFFVQPVEILPEAFDDESSHRNRLWGASFEDQRLDWLHFDTYYFGLRDRAGDPQRKLDTAGARVRRPAQAGQLDYELELMGQLGERGPRELSAFAGHAELGYSFARAWSPRLVLQLEYASGTADPDGEKTHAFDPLYGSRRFDLMPTAIFGAFRRTNIISPGVRLQLSPRRDLRVQLKARHWQLAQPSDGFAGSRLVDASGSAGRDLGSEFELQMQWNATPWLSFDVGFDYWRKGSYFERVPNSPSRENTYYFYTAAQVRF